MSERPRFRQTPRGHAEALEIGANPATVAQTPVLTAEELASAGEMIWLGPRPSQIPFIPVVDVAIESCRNCGSEVVTSMRARSDLGDRTLIFICLPCARAAGVEVPEGMWE